MLRKFMTRSLFLAVCLVGIVTWHFHTKMEQSHLNRALRDAIDNGNVAGVQLALRQGAHPNARGGERWYGVDASRSPLRIRLEVWSDEHIKGGPTALMRAVHGRQVQIIKILLEQGADVNATDQGVSPLAVLQFNELDNFRVRRSPAKQKEIQMQDDAIDKLLTRPLVPPVQSPPSGRSL